MARAAGRFDVAGDRSLGLEEPVTFDTKPGKALELGEFLQAYGAEFREPHAQICDCPGNLQFIRFNLGQQPSSAARGIEKLHDREEVELLRRAFDLRLDEAVLVKLLPLGLRDLQFECGGGSGSGLSR